MNRSLAFVLLLMSWSLGQYACAGVVLQESFESNILPLWRSYTDDDTPKGGWMIRQGVLSQEGANMDAEEGGRRILYQNTGLSLGQISFPLDIYLDVLPKEYEPPNDVYYGVCLLVEEPGIMQGNISVCLRTNTLTGNSGICIIQAKQERYSPEDTWRIESNVWYRLHICLEGGPQKDHVRVKAKAWPRDQEEPKPWLVESLFSHRILLSRELGVGMICYALRGSRKSPFALFDNLLLSDSLGRQPENVRAA